MHKFVDIHKFVKGHFQEINWQQHATAILAVPLNFGALSPTHLPLHGRAPVFAAASSSSKATAHTCMWMIQNNWIIVIGTNNTIGLQGNQLEQEHPQTTVSNLVVSQWLLKETSGTKEEEDDSKSIHLIATQQSNVLATEGMPPLQDQAEIMARCEIGNKNKQGIRRNTRTHPEKLEHC